MGNTTGQPIGGEIAATVAVFFPDYDASKLAAIVAGLEADVSTVCNLGGYVEGEDAELDAFIVRKAREAVTAELAGGVRSRSVEGYSETLPEGGEGAFTEKDLAFLGRKTQLIRGYK
jgi:hypothetical protein